MIRVLVITPGWEEEPRVETIEGTLAEFQRFVGGDVEAAPLREELRASGYINAEGKFDALDRNQLANALCDLQPGDYIAGPLVLTGPVDAKGDDTGASAELIAYVRGLAGLPLLPYDGDDTAGTADHNRRA